MGYLKNFQLEIMLVLEVICAMLTLFSFLTKYTTKKRRFSLILMSFSAMLMLMSDRWAYYYRGNTSLIGFWMVRVTNFLVFFLTLVIVYSFNEYLIDLCSPSVPKWLEYTKIIIFIGEIMIILSQFTGFYYYFDDNNCYQRGNGFFVCYLFPLLVLGIQLMVVIKNRKKFSNFLFIPILLFTVIPLIASIIQVFFYGISLTNIASIGLIVMLYIFSILDANTIIETAHKKEVELLQSEYEISKSMLIQTAEALASAIDAKDSYTNGHSKRVAEYSVMLAKCSGKTEEECEKIRIIALLHDIGKIGIPDDVINKNGRLTDEEFEKIKEHPAIGYDILSKIKISPELSIGAHYHHERYDGKGYPDGLKGDEIPEVSRLIAVADSYDAMTSKRSYRDSLPQEIVRDEIVKGIGTQFDPTYAWYMIRLIDQDKDYQMRQM